MMDPPWHCGKVMQPDHTEGERIAWICAHSCGHRAYTGPIGVLKPSAQALLPMRRLCQLCHEPLPARSHHQTKYHRHCRDALKRQAAKAYAKGKKESP